MEDQDGFVSSIRSSPVSDILFWCPVSSCELVSPIQDPSEFLSHLRSAHSVTVDAPVEVIPFLQQYVDAYSAELGQKPENAPLVLSGDGDLRRSLQQRKLETILEIQQRERSADHLQPRACLFCAHSSSSKYELFRHMFDVHGFNIGLLDNLVEVNEFLNLLESKLKRLECIYCQKQLKSASVLRKHMRKKKHFRIHPRNHLYDKYYVVNFTEPGKSWEQLEGERNLRDLCPADSGQESPEEEISLRTQCLFGDACLECPAAALAHLREAHSLDFEAAVKSRGLSFYDCVKVINYIRDCSCNLRCYACGDGSFDEMDAFVAHVNSHSLRLPIEHVILQTRDTWSSDEYLKPRYEDDPMLMEVDRLTETL